MNGNEELPSKSIYFQIEKDGNLPNAELNHILALLHNEVKPDVVKSRMSVKSANKQTGKWKVIKTSGAPPPYSSHVWRPCSGLSCNSQAYAAE